MNSFLLEEYRILLIRCENSLCHFRWHRELRDIAVIINRDYIRNPSRYEYLNIEENSLLNKIRNNN